MLLVLGLVVIAIVTFASTFHSSRFDFYVIFVGWIWGYLLLIWGAAAVILLILLFEDAALGYMIPALLKGSSLFRKICALAIDLEDSFVAIVAQFIVALLMNLLLLFILFSPVVLRYLVPPIEMVQPNLPEMLTTIRSSFLYAVFLWFIPGAFGPAILYGVKYARFLGFKKNIRHITSVIQTVCYLSILAACLELISGPFGIGIIDPKVFPFFVNIYVGLVTPSTFAGIAVMRLFKSDSHLQEALAIFLFSLLIVIFTVFMFGLLDTDAGRIMIIASMGLLCLAAGQTLFRRSRLRRR